ncbi:MAG: hypothetical protein V2A53_04105 [bacterium]
MEIVDKVKKIIQELIIPELEIIKGENAEIKTILQLTNKRIDDINIHLVDQSRRIDDFRVELKDEIAKNTLRIDETNKRIDKLYEVIVRRDEHKKLETRIITLEHKVVEIRKDVQQRLAA